MKRKILTGFMALCLIVALAACSGGNNAASNQETAPNSESAVNENGEVDYAFGAFDKEITLHTVTSEYASATYPDGDDVTNNVWTRAYKEKFNVNVVTDWVSDEYDTKLNLAISSNSLPDVFHVNASQLQQLVGADMVWDLTDVFDKYASERLKGYMAADQASYESGMVDGKLFGIPQMHWGIIEQPDYIWIRNDWKEELGLKDPESMEDVKNIALEFKKKYGGYGITADKTLDHLNLTAIAWHAYPDMWIPGADGSIVYGSVQPEMKAALAEWAEWYKLGILDPEFATKDFNAMVSDVVAGKVGVQPYFQWWGYNPGVDTVTNQGKEAIFEPYLIPSADGQEVKQSIFFANGAYTVASKKFKTPEAAIKLLNYYAYMVDEGQGKEDPKVLSGFMDNDMAHVVGALRVLNPNSDYEQYEKVSVALKSKDTSKLTTSGMWQKYNNSVDFIANGTPAAVGDYLQQGAPRSAYGLAKDIIDSNKTIKSKLWGATPEVLANYGTTLDDILTEGFTKIIMNVESIDYFDTVVANWKAAGGEEATQAMNEKYGE